MSRANGQLVHGVMSWRLPFLDSTAATPASLFLAQEVNHPLGLKWKLSKLELDKDARSMEEFWDTTLIIGGRHTPRLLADTMQEEDEQSFV
jgi:hypothetical protein